MKKNIKAVNIKSSEFMLFFYFVSDTLARFGNNLVADHTGFPEKIGDLTIVKSSVKHNRRNGYYYATYTNTEGEMFFSKMWNRRLKDFSYRLLKKEIKIVKIIENVEKRLKNKSQFKVVIPKIRSWHENETRLIAVYDYIETKKSVKSAKTFTSSLRVVSEYLEYLGKNMTNAEREAIGRRPATFMMFLYGLSFVKSIITHPRYAPLTIKNLLHVLLNSRILYGKDLIFSHRDLDLNNLILKKGNVYVTDFALASFALPLYEETVPLLRHWENLGVRREILKLVSTSEKISNMQNFFKLLSILVATHFISGGDLSGRSVNRYGNFLKGFNKIEKSRLNTK